VKCTAASLLILPGSGEVDKDAAHQPGCHGEKVRPVLPVHVLRIHEPQVGLVDKGGGLEVAGRALAADTPSGNPLQFLVDEGSQSGERGVVTRSPRQ
jgi:hypothetical protein